MHEVWQLIGEWKEKNGFNRKIKEKKINYWWDCDSEKGKEGLIDCIASLDTDRTKYSFEAEKKKETEISVAALDAALDKLEKDLKALE